MGVLYTYEGLEHHAVALHTRDCVNTLTFFFSIGNKRKLPLLSMIFFA